MKLASLKQSQNLIARSCDAQRVTMGNLKAFGEEPPCLVSSKKLFSVSHKPALVFAVAVLSFFLWRSPGSLWWNCLWEGRPAAPTEA